MVGKELDAGTVDCRFPSVRKTYWRSATWNSHSAPPSPKLDPFPLERGGGGGGSAAPTDATALPYTPRSQEHNQNTRSRVSLPPLQPLSIARKNLEEWPSAGLDDTGDWTTPATPGRRRVKTGPDIKLDLASVQRTVVEPTEIQLKRDKFAHFDKQCSRVANYHIYLGSDAVARDREALRANEITHVLNCVGFVCPEYFKRELVYKTLWLQDSPCEDITSLLYDVFDYFEEVREQGGRVFVHCCQGVSRSTSLVIAYLMWRERSSFEDAFQDVKAARGVTNPNMGFACQLLQCQKRVHATPMSPTSVLRMYRLAPHSPYDPLHLVPKALNNPGAGSLDSRGAFVIHIPCAIFVWIGQDCDPKMAQAAKEAAGQVVRYERAEGPVQVLVEGHEGPEFWESLNNYSVSRGECTSAGLACLSEEHAEDFHLDSSCQAEKRRTNQDEVERVKQLGVGNRKVQSHDVDYDLYRTARLGGVIPPVPFMGVGMATIPTRIPAREDGWSVLRRKFLLGELVSAKETATPGKSNINVLSPDTSMGSSSPHYSPFSVTSTSSSAPAGSDSPFASPISVLGNLSPADTMQANTAPISLSISPSHPFISSLSIPSPMKTLSAQCANKCPAFSLAQRRGSVPPTLRLPGLEDDPPPAPRGMSRKPKLPPLVTIEKYRAEKAVKENEDTNFRFQALGEMCKGLVGVNDYMAAQLQLPLTTSSMQSSERAARDDEGQNYLQIRSTSTAGDSQCPEPRSPCKSIPEVGHAFLYLWPGLERIDMFDVDDLDTRAVFVLVEAAFHPRRNGQGIGVYVWVGRQLATNKGHQNESSRSEGEAMWLQVGKDFLDRMQLPTDVPIRVVREGQEPEEFWETFNQG